MSNSAKHTASGSIGLAGALFLIFVALRLTDHIDWSWYWVVAPLWMPLVSGLVLVLAFFVTVMPVCWLLDRRAAQQRQKLRGVRIK